MYNVVVVAVFSFLWGRDVAQLVVSDWHAVDTGLIPLCFRFFSQNQLSEQILLRVSIHPHMQSHALTFMCILNIL